MLGLEVVEESGDCIAKAESADAYSVWGLFIADDVGMVDGCGGRKGRVVNAFELSHSYC